MTHAASDFLDPAVQAALQAEKAVGRLGQIGASVYTAEEIDAIINTGGADLVQVPLSILDRRMETQGALAACAAAGIAVHARSVFLQGALLMRAEDLPAHLAPLGPIIAQLETLASTAGTSVASIALRLVRDTPGVVSVVVGAYNPSQLQELVEAAAAPHLEPGLVAEMEQITAHVPESCIDPRGWPPSR